jgi:hypothetical protein
LYGKIFDSMYRGTLYGQWEAIVTFQQLIVLCDADGVVDYTPPAISSITSIPLEIIQKGLEVLAKPDPYSRTPGADGRRIELIDAHRPWGWVIVNHKKYQNLQDSDTVRAQTRERVRRHRELKRSVTDGNGQKRHTDTDTDTNTDTDTKKQSNGRAVALPDWLPEEPWNAWLEVRSKNRAPNTPRALRLAVTELAKLKAAGQDVRAVLEQSTLRGWRGVFAVKEDRSNPDYSQVIANLKD